MPAQNGQYQLIISCEMIANNVVMVDIEVMMIDEWWLIDYS